MSDETLLFRGSPSPMKIFGLFAICAMVLVGAVAGGLLASPWLALLAVPALLVALGGWISLKTLVYEVTSERIRVRRGLLTLRTDELELYRVQDLSLLEPFVARMFRLGTIVVTTNDKTTPVLEIQWVRGAHDLREALRASVEACRTRRGVRVTELE